MIHSDMKKIVDLLIGIPDIPMIAYGKEFFYKNGLYPAEILFTIEGAESGARSRALCPARRDHRKKNGGCYHENGI